MASQEQVATALKELAAAIEEIRVIVSEPVHKKHASSMSAFLWVFCITTFFLGIGIFVFQEVVLKCYKKVRAPLRKLLLVDLDVLLWGFCSAVQAVRRVIVFVLWDVFIPPQVCQAVVRGWVWGVWSVWVALCWVKGEVKGRVEEYQEWRREIELCYQAIVPTEPTGVTHEPRCRRDSEMV